MRKILKAAKFILFAVVEDARANLIERPFRQAVRIGP
jgi:hypothetical protein